MELKLFNIVNGNEFWQLMLFPLFWTNKIDTGQINQYHAILLLLRVLARHLAALWKDERDQLVPVIWNFSDFSVKVRHRKAKQIDVIRVSLFHIFNFFSLGFQLFFSFKQTRKAKLFLDKCKKKFRKKFEKNDTLILHIFDWFMHNRTIMNSMMGFSFLSKSHGAFENRLDARNDLFYETNYFDAMDARTCD